MEATFNAVRSLVVTLDDEAKIIDMNPRAEQIAGFTLSEIQGRHVGSALLLPEELEEVQQAIERVKDGQDSCELETHILTKHGVKYCGDFVFDDEPTVMRTDNGELITVPYTVELNDIPMMLVQHHESEHFARRVLDQFDRLYAEGEHRAKFLSVAVHPYISGVPHRIKYFEQIFEAMAARPGVAFWTGEQIYEWFMTARQDQVG